MQISNQIVIINKPIPNFFTGRMPFMMPNQQCQSTEGKSLCYLRKIFWRVLEKSHVLWLNGIVSMIIRHAIFDSGS